MNTIVTGASRGIGFELALKFASREGFNVLAISRNRQRLEELQKQCREALPGKDISVLQADLEDIPGIETSLLNAIKKNFSQVDILVNNAGSLVKAPIAELSQGDSERMFRVNYLAPLVLTRSLVPMLEKSAVAHVVNIGSMAGVQGARKFPGLSVYSASKAACHVLAESFTAEYEDTAIRFNTLALGSVQTEMLAEAFPGLKAPVTPAEMADFILEFALNGGRYFNGKILPVALGTP